jgi:RNA polymerase sigma-70 factor, ECF subfamily
VETSPANLAEAKPQTESAVAPCATGVGAELAVASAFGPVDRLLPEKLGNELWRNAGAERVDLSETEFAEALEAIGTQVNFGVDPGIHASANQREAFWRALHLEELAIARGCALGRETAWERFLAQYRVPLTRAAVEMSGSTSLGEELADALYSDLFGLTEREGKRWSPLLRYSGRGSLIGWLRALLAQRRVNLYRKTSRETALDEIEPEAPAVEPLEFERLGQLGQALETALAKLSPEERFLLSAYYLDMHTLKEVSLVLGVHEATVSRKLRRATVNVRKELMRALVAQGLSRRAAEEMLETDPGDVDINMRKLLQNPVGRAISNKEGRE